MSTPQPPRLDRRLGLSDAVVIGLGAMIGAGVFAAFGPAAAAAGSGLLIGLLVAGLVAYCNATSSARLAAIYPESGGTYVYGRKRLGDFWGYLAGWSFVVGKTASCAAMALTFGSYVAPHHVRAVGVIAVVALTGLNLLGVQRSAGLTRLLVVATLIALAVVVVACLSGGTASREHLSPFPGTDLRGVLESAGLLFFAFAGYARVATLGEEVIAPARTIPRAVAISLGVTFVVYAVVALSVLLAVGPEGAGHAECTASRCGAGGFARRAGAGRGDRRRGGRARILALADPGRLAHHHGDGSRPPPAGRTGRGPPAVRRAAPRRDSRRASS